ncbi:DUF6230 family protein [Haloechinothrix sp. LS1_15]|uniref:DUF6230 family protein n=1 Tax=Haloechinothrix sp. LS1_15 TaxID=2652248 RepID=UPI0029450088|nr:DUF6230 family protein [Haloechinothrix sp. LS1_15]MDV6012364.1 hypothetical protein [Haloechinothrix sp. LS1_15]
MSNGKHGSEGLISRARTRLHDRRERRRSTGHTRWRRFVAVLGVGGVAAGLLVTAMAQGAVAASFAVAGTTFKIDADRLEGNGLVLYGNEVNSSDGTKAAATMGLRSTQIDNFCTGFVVNNLPVLDAVSVKLDIPGGVDGDNLIIDVSDLRAESLTLNDAHLGIDASQVESGPGEATGQPGSAALDASGLSATNLDGDSWAINAGTLTAHGLSVSARQGTGNTCG